MVILKELKGRLRQPFKRTTLNIIIQKHGGWFHNSWISTLSWLESLSKGYSLVDYTLHDAIWLKRDLYTSIESMRMFTAKDVSLYKRALPKSLIRIPWDWPNTLTMHHKEVTEQALRAWTSRYTLPKSSQPRRCLNQWSNFVIINTRASKLHDSLKPPWVLTPEECFFAYYTGKYVILVYYVCIEASPTWQTVYGWLAGSLYEVLRYNILVVGFFWYIKPPNDSIPRTPAAAAAMKPIFCNCSSFLPISSCL